MPRTYQTIRSVRRSGATTINLAKRRTWFADGDPAGDQQNKQGGSESKYNPQTVEDAMKIIAAIYESAANDGDKRCRTTPARRKATANPNPRPAIRSIRAISRC